MAIKATNQSILASGQGNNLSFKDILVDMKPDSRTGKTSRKLRLVGEASIYMEYNARYKDYDDLDDKGRPIVKERLFPDKDKKKSITRIGADNPEECYWATNGYQGSKKYAINCLERQEDGTSIVKILNKGATVFKPFAEYENGALSEKLEDGVDDACTFLGGRVARDVRVTCYRDAKAPGGVRYEVNILSKVTEITDEEIAALKVLGCPSEEDMKQYKKEYKARMADSPGLPPFEEFFEYGHNLRAIFKYQPPALDDPEGEEEDEPIPAKVAKSASAVKPTAKAVKVEDEDDEDAPVAPKTKKIKAVVESDDDDSDKPAKPANVFAGLGDDDEEEEWAL